MFCYNFKISKVLIAFSLLSCSTITTYGVGDPLSSSSRLTTTVLAVGAVAYSAFNTAWRLLTGHEWNSSAPSANNDNSVVAAPLEEVKLEEPESFEGSDFYTEIHSNSPSVRGLVLPNDSPFERRYLPNGIDINSPFVREEVLPTTDHNCALFGIYGRNDVTRAEVIAELVAAGIPQTDLGIRIRTLMAPEILAYLLEATDRTAAMQLLGGGHQSPDRRDQIILNLLPNLLQQYEANPTDDNRIKLLKTLAHAKVFENYVRQVLRRRIGPSNRDPYPMLGYIRGDTVTAGMTGALPAIAAMRGVVKLNVHQRQGRDIVQIAGYVQDPRLTPQGNHQVVDLLHTTADVNNPGVLNHFNRLLRYERREEFKTFQADLDTEDPMTYIRMFCLPSESGHYEDSSANYPGYTVWNHKVYQWISQLGFKTELLDNVLMAIFQSNEKAYDSKLNHRQTQFATEQKKQMFLNSHQLLDDIERFYFADFPIVNPDIEIAWSLTLKNFIDVAIALGNREQAANKSFVSNCKKIFSSRIRTSARKRPNRFGNISTNMLASYSKVLWMTLRLSIVFLPQSFK